MKNQSISKNKKNSIDHSKVEGKYIHIGDNNNNAVVIFFGLLAVLAFLFAVIIIVKTDGNMSTFKDKVEEKITENKDTTRNVSQIPKEKTTVNKEIPDKKEIPKNPPSVAENIPKKKRDEKKEIPKVIVNPPIKDTKKCYQVRMSANRYLVFRNQPLTREEINALNSCTAWGGINGKTTYEDLTRKDCMIKKRLDEQSMIGGFVNGDIVEFIGRQGNWNEVIDMKTGKKGFISRKYGGVLTLKNTICN